MAQADEALAAAHAVVSEAASSAGGQGGAVEVSPGTHAHHTTHNTHTRAHAHVLICTYTCTGSGGGGRGDNVPRQHGVFQRWYTCTHTHAHYTPSHPQNAHCKVRTTRYTKTLTLTQKHARRADGGAAGDGGLDHPHHTRRRA